MLVRAAALLRRAPASRVRPARRDWTGRARAVPCRALSAGGGGGGGAGGGDGKDRIDLDQVFAAVEDVASRSAREARDAAEARAEVARSGPAGGNARSSSLRWQLIAAKAARANYLLRPKDLEPLAYQERQNPYAPDGAAMRMYWVHDVERASVARWGSLEAMDEERDRREVRRLQRKSSYSAATAPQGDHNRTAAAAARRTSTLLGRLLDLERQRTRADRRRSKGAAQPGSSGLTAVNTAIGTNGLLFVAKLGAFTYTGSAAMLSEALHSLADCANQALLRVGIQLSSRPSDATHPYGYGTERYVWSLISGVGIFFMGCAVSVYHGISTMMAGAEVQSAPVALGVLGTSLLLEGYTLAVAVREVRRQAEETGLTLREYMVAGPDPMNVAVVAEDSAAVAGVGIATLALGASTITGNPVYDAVGSIAVGGLMGGVAVFLIQRNRDLLVGRSLHPERLEAAVRALRDDSVVASVHDVKAVMMGNVGRFKAELLFNAEVLATKMVERRYGDMHTANAALRNVGSDTELEDLFIRNSADLLSELGREVDRLEEVIRGELPEMRYVDLEVL